MPSPGGLAAHFNSKAKSLNWLAEGAVAGHPVTECLCLRDSRAAPTNGDGSGLAL